MIVARARHPSPLRAKVTPVARPSEVLLALTVLAGIPLIAYSAGQLRTHLASGPGDEHDEFGHWLVVASVAIISVALGLVAAAKVPAWRVPLWTSDLMVAALGVGSLGITAVSQLWTPRALLAIMWGGAFIAAGEIEARRNAATVASEGTHEAAAVR